MEADKDGDGKLSFEEFTNMVANTVRMPNQIFNCYRLMYYTTGHREANDT